MLFENLLSPIKIGQVVIKNRFVVPPMDTALPEEDGTINQRTIDYYAERAKGGFGLIISEYSYVDPRGMANPRTIAVWDDKFLPGLTKLAEVVHRYDGAKIFLQLHHAGRQGHQALTGHQVMAPSPLYCPVCRELPYEFTTEEVYDLIERFGDGALRAQQAGFDGVELHGGHGYLINQFMSAYSNKRIDEFGGNFKSRMLFPELIIKNIRKKVGNSFPIIMRISVEELVNGGRTVMEGRMIASYLESIGLDGINCSQGVYAATTRMMYSNQMPSGGFTEMHRQIKESVSIPVITGGKLSDPYLAEEIVAKGLADMVYLGRQSLADPEYPNKIAAAAYDEIRPCFYCMDRCFKHLENPDEPICCVMNPLCAREGEMKIEMAAEPKKVVIVGAGPGGLEAAIIAAQRGHKVTVFEKEGEIGGQLRYAAMPPFKENLLAALKYWQAMCKKLRVNIVYNTEATKEIVAAELPDAVILATGAKPIILPIPGFEDKLIDAIDVIGGKVMVQGNVLILGGGEVGLETADFLGERWNRITIMDMVPELGACLSPYIKVHMFNRLFKEYGVQQMTGCKVKEVLDDGVVYEKDDKVETTRGYTAIINAMGAKAYNPLEQELTDVAKELYVIGDAVKARTVSEAIEEGAKIALKL